MARTELTDAEWSAYGRDPAVTKAVNERFRRETEGQRVDYPKATARTSTILPKGFRTFALGAGIAAAFIAAKLPQDGQGKVFIPRGSAPLMYLLGATMLADHKDSRLCPFPTWVYNMVGGAMHTTGLMLSVIDHPSFYESGGVFYMSWIPVMTGMLFPFYMRLKPKLLALKSSVLKRVEDARFRAAQSACKDRIERALEKSREVVKNRYTRGDYPLVAFTSFYTKFVYMTALRKKTILVAQTHEREVYENVIDQLYHHAQSKRISGFIHVQFLPLRSVETSFADAVGISMSDGSRRELTRDIILGALSRMNEGRPHPHGMPVVVFTGIDQNLICTKGRFIKQVYDAWDCMCIVQTEDAETTDALIKSIPDRVSITSVHAFE